MLVLVLVCSGAPTQPTRRGASIVDGGAFTSLFVGMTGVRAATAGWSNKGDRIVGYHAGQPATEAASK